MHKTAKPTTLGRRVVRGAIWSGAGAILLRIANLAIMVAAARILIPHDFGVFAVAITVHMVVASLSELGVASVLMRAETDPDEVASTIAAIAIASGIVLGGAMAVFAEPIATLLGAADAAAPVRVLSLAVVISGFFAVPGAQLAREFRQDRIFLAAITGFVPANALLLMLALNGGGAMSFAWSRVVGQLVAGLVMVLCVGKHYWPRLRRGVSSRVLRFGLPLAAANVLSWTLLNADFVVVGRVLGAEQLGLYMLAFNVASWSTSLLGAMINGVAMPAFSRIRDDPVALARAVSRSTQAVALVAFPISALTLVLAPALVDTLYGPKWTSAGPVLATLAAYGGTSVICLLFTNLLIGRGHPRLVFGLQLAWLVALVPAMVIGAKADGIVGAGVAHVVVALGLMLPVYLIVLRRLHLARPSELLRAIAAPAAGAGVAGLAAAAIAAGVSSSPVELLLGGAVGVLVYLIAVSPLARDHLKGRIGQGGATGRLVRAYSRLGETVAWPLGQLSLERRA